MDRIRQKCLDNGLLSEADIESLSDQQIQQYIFNAGFSTAEKVTSVSGRGVGMDVVRTSIEKIGGTVELKSVEGKGTTFTIKIPLILAIVSALIVECCSERFAIPQISVLELVRASTQSDNAIEVINESPVLRLRNRLLPLVSLESLLKLDRTAADAMVDLSLLTGPEDAVAEAGSEKAATADDAAESNADPLEGLAGGLENDELFIVVTQVGANTFGIIVDRVFDTEEIVVKPVSPILRDISF